MTNEELEHGSFEIENRIRNLMWTISGDYDLDTKPDVTSFYKSKYISIYDAIKQGAFSRFFDKDAFALYLLKKVYLGADESQLVTLGQICVEAAAMTRSKRSGPVSRISAKKRLRRSWTTILKKCWTRIPEKSNLPI